MKKLLASLALIACANSPLEEHKCYDSTLNYIMGERNNECLREKDGEYKLFVESDPVTVENGDLSVTYVGELNGRGYCLTPAYAKIIIRSYCSLDGRNLDACIWSDIINGKPRRVVQLRAESDSCNGNAWNVLDTVFEQAKADFLSGINFSPEYKFAARRVININQ